jgi:antitoxin component of MazEF toxin-antitoxin module
MGHSLAIRIPSGVAKGAHLREGTAIEVSADEAQIVLRHSSQSLSSSRPVNGISHGWKPKYTLDELLARVTDEDLQDLIKVSLAWYNGSAISEKSKIISNSLAFRFWICYIW